MMQARRAKDKPTIPRLPSRPAWWTRVVALALFVGTSVVWGTSLVWGSASSINKE